MGKKAQLTTHDAIRVFVLGGKAVFTLVNKTTGNRFTYKVVAKLGKDDEVNRYQVWVLNGPNNVADFHLYAGTIFPGKVYKFQFKRRENDPPASAKAFSWFFDQIAYGRAFPSSFEFWHAGRCCFCTRSLTVDLSIKTGMGPKCAADRDIDLNAYADDDVGDIDDETDGGENYQ